MNNPGKTMDCNVNWGESCFQYGYNRLWSCSL